MTNERSKRGSIALTAVVLLGCGPTVRSLDRHAAAIGAEDAPVVAQLSPGRRLLVPPECPGRVASTMEEVVDGGGGPLAGDAAFEKLATWTVRDAAVAMEGPSGQLLVELERAGQVRWLGVDEAQLRCLRVPTSATDRALARVGSEVRLAVGRPGCARIVARGPAARSTFLESEGSAHRVVAVRAPEARQEGPLDLWAELDNGTLVRDDVIERCFAPASGGEAPAQDLPSVLRIEPGRCTSDEEQGKVHVECRTSVGVWAGTLGDAELSLTATRRTLGDLHFSDGHLVSGKRWARATISLAMGKADDGASRDVQEALIRSLATAASKLEGVRVVSRPEEARYRLRLDVRSVAVGPVSTQKSTERTEYQDGERDVPNPEHPRAERAVEDAQEALDRAREEFREAQQRAREERQLRDQALEECKRQARQATDRTAGQIAESACGIGQIINSHTGDVERDAVDRAESELANARNTLRDTPRTVREPIMKPWTYEKTTYSRRASATVTVAIQTPGASSPVVEDLPVAVTWSDHEVRADPAHNVTGHSVDRRFLESEQALVTPLAERAGDRVAERVREIAAGARRTELRRALAEAGADTKEGYETVDGAAFHALSGRPMKPLRRGQLQVGELTLEAPDVRLDPGDCAVVALASESAKGSVVIRSASGAIADLRRGPVATVEVCHGDAAGAVPLLVLSSLGGGARWGIYRSRSSR